MDRNVVSRNFMKQTILINTDEKPITERHIAFFATQDSAEQTCTVFEVVEATYNYPDCGEMVLHKLEIRRGKTEKISSTASAPIRLIEIANEKLASKILQMS